jgi:hypothetical protein
MRNTNRRAESAETIILCTFVNTGTKPHPEPSRTVGSRPASPLGAIIGQNRIKRQR